MSRALGNYSYVACKIYGGPRRRRLLTGRRAPLLALPFSVTTKRALRTPQKGVLA